MTLIISTPSRLHLGFFNLSAGSARSYGGFGVALARPRLTLSALASPEVRVSGDWEGVLGGYARKFIGEFDIDGGVEISVSERIPRHVGLGSGTQSALAVGSALSKLYGVSADPKLVAEKLGRGRVSGVGVGVFSGGGLVVDGGHARGDEKPPPIVFSRVFPDEWSFIVVVPSAKEGLSGITEKKAMQNVSSTASVSVQLSDLFLTRVLPSLEERNVEVFGRALTEIDGLVGGVFSPAQGGLYSQSASAGVIDFMLSSGVYGAGQSSWGPAVYGLVDARNRSIAGEVGDFMREKEISGEVYFSRVDNTGVALEKTGQD